MVLMAYVPFCAAWGGSLVLTFQSPERPDLVTGSGRGSVPVLLTHACSGQGETGHGADSACGVYSLVRSQAWVRAGKN